MAHSFDTALVLGWLKPATSAAEDEPKAEHPYRSLLDTIMGVRPTASA